MKVGDRVMVNFNYFEGVGCMYDGGVKVFDVGTVVSNDPTLDFPVLVYLDEAEFNEEFRAIELTLI